MASPNINDCASGVPQQFYDLEAVNYSGNYVPTKANGVARGILCIAAGTAIVDAYGITGAGTGSTSVSVPMTAGQQIQLAFTKIHSGSSGSYIALY